jgi:hypothetical protein
VIKINEALEAVNRIEAMIKDTDKRQANGENVTKKIKISVRGKK